MLNPRVPLVVAAITVVAILLSSCSGDDTSEGTTTVLPTTTTIVEIESDEATPVEIDVAEEVIPTDPEAPPDDFAVGESTPTDPRGRPYLHPGDEGDDVAALQRRLIDLGYPVEDSGVFDDATLAAVLTFQRSQQLVADGVVGTRTWAALDAPRPPSTTGSTGGNASTTGGDGAAVPSLDPPPDDPAQSSKVDRAEVLLADQRVRLFDGDRLVAEYPVSSGRNGLTPRGSFKVQSKSARTVSNSDSSISMQWMTRFNGGIGFHGIPVKAGTPLPTPLGVQPVSAGCIRMADDAAKAVFDRLPIGAIVVVR